MVGINRIRCGQEIDSTDWWVTLISFRYYCKETNLPQSAPSLDLICFEVFCAQIIRWLTITLLRLWQLVK